MFVQIGRYMDDDDDVETWHRHKNIVIHDYDTWNMDNTLAMIIHPMLIQLKAEKHGAPFVDMEDRPEHLRCEVVKYETDKYHFEAWDWVMDEMIWAFGQHGDENEEDPFYTYDEDFDEFEGNIQETMAKIHIDSEGLKAHHERKQRAFELFGKYYTGLWD